MIQQQGDQLQVTNRLRLRPSWLTMLDMITVTQTPERKRGRLANHHDMNESTLQPGCRKRSLAGYWAWPVRGGCRSRNRQNGYISGSMSWAGWTGLQVVLASASAVSWLSSRPAAHPRVPPSTSL